MAEPLPHLLADLVAALEAEGFQVVTDESSGHHFGNRLIELIDRAHPTVQAVRCVRDRGLWDVEIKLAGQLYDPYQVVQAQNGAKYSQRALSHRERHDLTLRAIRSMPRDKDDLAPVLERLADYRRAYRASFERPR